jgi:hypothetical protein
VEGQSAALDADAWHMPLTPPGLLLTRNTEIVVISRPMESQMTNIHPTARLLEGHAANSIFSDLLVCIPKNSTANSQRSAVL